MDQHATEKEVVRLLQIVLSGGDVAPASVMALAGADFSPRAAQAWHQLAHWVSDEDVRAGDAAYASAQLDGLRQQLAALNCG